MRRFLMMLFVMSTVLLANGQNSGYGNMCDQVNFVDSTLSQNIEANHMYVFGAQTEDLPVVVYFYPDEEYASEPLVYVDLTCESGVYDDENVRDIVDIAAIYDVYFPFGLPFEKLYQDGRTVYRMSYDRSLLDLLAVLGVDYSIPVYVAFQSEVSGVVQMNNMKAATQCTELCQRVDLQDTLYLRANAENRFYFPVEEWSGNNLSFTWLGDGDVRAYLETDCEFDTLTSRYVYDFADTDSRGYAVQKVSQLALDNYIESSEDGNLYALFVASEDGKVYLGDYVDHGSVTLNSCIGNLKSTAINFPTTDLSLAAKIPTKSYRIQASAIQDKNIRMKWKTTENKLAVAYFANFCGFEIKATDPDVIDTVHFVYNEEEQAMIADIPLDRVNKIVKQNTEGWLFMQIYRQEAGTFSWDTYQLIEPDCDVKSVLLQPNDSVYMPANYYNTSYKLVADDWDNLPNTITWRGTRKAFVYIADTCDFPLAPYNIHVGKYLELNPNQSVEISQKDLAKLAKNYALDGNLYLRLRSDAEGSLVTCQTKPQDVTVEFNVTECDSYTWHGTIYTESGTYQHLGQTTLGADSLEILHLTINHSVSLEETVVACDSYTWNGNTYTTSGDYVYNGKTISDCDSIVTLKLTINYSDTAEFNATTCEPYLWNGVEYAESGTYTYLTQTAQGCDSLMILHLTVHCDDSALDDVAISGRSSQLVMINQSLYILVSDVDGTRYYDLVGRPVKFE